MNNFTNTNTLGRKFLLILLILITTSPYAQNYEQASNLQASKILPANWLKSNLYQIDETVANDGYINTYTIHSDYGDFTAHGLTLLKIRLHEIKAIEELEKVKKSRLVVDAAANTIILPVKAVAVFAKNPVKTVKAIPSGVGRMFKGLGRSTKALFKKTNPNKNKNTSKSKVKIYAEKFMGVTRSQRKWAKKLSVDPYSSNQVLQKKLGEVAKIDAVANFSTGLLLPGIGAFNVIASTSNLAWQFSPQELRAQNFKHLQNQGVDKELINDFLNNEMFSPNLQTIIVTSLLDMQGVKNRSIVLEKASWVDSEEMAFFFTDTVRMLSEFNSTQSKLTRLTGDSAIMGAMTGNNRLIYTLPIDHLVWSKEFARTFENEKKQNGVSREFWLRGTATTKTIEELGKVGWTVKQNVEEKVKEKQSNKS
ncbi:MAG: hypothetical protein L3J53_02595 [Proteobacteria bacterium]|nr:hypothetical protein [Pseudomonadota bacterium]